MLRRSRMPALIAGTVATLSLSALLTTGAEAASSTVTACVNKKTGATKILLGAKARKKCPKGFTKVTWSAAGKDGVNGTNGKNGADGKSAAPLQVRDSTGTVLGTYMGINPLLSFTSYMVLTADGGMYNYLPDGELYTSIFLSGGPVFLDPACTGTAYQDFGKASPTVVGWFSGPPRVVYRSGTALGALGTPRVWKYTGTTSTVPNPAPTVYQLDPAGACVAMPGPFPAPPAAGNTLVALASTPAPPDGVGPLTIG